jgi:hypothetical protein
MGTTLDPAGLDALDDRRAPAEAKFPRREEDEGAWVDELLARAVQQNVKERLEVFDIGRRSTPGESMLPPQFRRRFRRTL